VFAHDATYTPGHEVDQISSEPQRAVVRLEANGITSIERSARRESR
jgi:hypothetical protein